MRVTQGLGMGGLGGTLCEPSLLQTLSVLVTALHAGCHPISPVMTCQ